MKKKNPRRKKKKSTKKKTSAAVKRQVAERATSSRPTKQEETKQTPVRSIPKKAVEAKTGERRSILQKGLRFLGEAKMELKKVKWPTRKELLASTAVVIVLSLVVAAFLGLVDLGLIEIIKGIIR